MATDMYDFKASAIRTPEGIEVVLSGVFPNSCWVAEVREVHPSLGATESVPGAHATVDITLSNPTPNAMCLMILVPWIRTVMLASGEYETVQIKVNGTVALDIKINDLGDLFSVIAPVYPRMAGMNINCSVIPAHVPFIMTHSRIYGPASKEDCETWIQTNCRASGAELMSTGLTSEARKEVIIEFQDGEAVHVEFDGRDTRSYHSRGGGSQSGGDRFNEVVNDFISRGGRITYGGGSGLPDDYLIQFEQP